LGERIDSVLALTRTVDESALEELEMSLIASDIGVTTSAEIAGNLRERRPNGRQRFGMAPELKDLLKEQAASDPGRELWAPGEGCCASGSDHDGWGQRHRQNDNEREAGRLLSHAGKNSAALRGRYPFAPGRPLSSWRFGANAAASR